MVGEIRLDKFGLLRWNLTISECKFYKNMEEKIALELDQKTLKKLDLIKRNKES